MTLDSCSCVPTLICLPCCCLSAVTFRSFVGDIEQLLDHLNIQKVVFIGVSGGGPYACACARFLPDRTAALGLVAGMTHCAGPGSASLTRNQHWTNRFGMTAVAWAPAAVGASLAVVRPLARIAPGVVGWWLSKFGRVGPARAAVTWVATTGFSMADYRALVKRPSGILPLLWVVSGAFETGWRGVLHDMWITINPWDFSISDIPASIPTQIFQGAEDVCVTVDMAQHLKQGIPQAKLTVFPGEGHLSIVMYQASLMLQAMVAAASR